MQHIVIIFIYIYFLINQICVALVEGMLKINTKITHTFVIIYYIYIHYFVFPETLDCLET